MSRFFLKLSVIAALSMLLSAPVMSRGLGDVSVWHEGAGNKLIKMTLTIKASGDRKRIVLIIESEGTRVIDNTEMKELLTKAFVHMSILGYDPKHLVAVNTWLESSRYREGLQKNFEKNYIWKRCIRKKYCREVEGSASQYLESIHAYKYLNRVLYKHGLMIKSINIGDLAVSHSSKGTKCWGLIVINFTMNVAKNKDL